MRVHGTQIVHTVAPKYLYRDYFKAKAYTSWVHGPLGYSTCCWLSIIFSLYRIAIDPSHEVGPPQKTQPRGSVAILSPQAPSQKRLGPRAGAIQCNCWECRKPVHTCGSLWVRCILRLRLIPQKILPGLGCTKPSKILQGLGSRKSHYEISGVLVHSASRSVPGTQTSSKVLRKAQQLVLGLDA